MPITDLSPAETLKRWVQNFSTLETPRISIRRLSMGDDHALYDTMKNQNVNRWISGFAQPFDLSALRRWMAYRLERMERGEGVYGGIYYRNTNVLLGFMHAVWEPELDGVEVAAAFQEIYWGKGLLEEAGFAVVCDLFSADIPTIVATSAMENHASHRALEGFNFELKGQVDIKTPQGLRPSWLYRLTEERFRKARIMPMGNETSHEEVRARRLAIIKQGEAMRARKR